MSKSNEPAHPILNHYGDKGRFRTEFYHHGLTKREYFAGLAMQGLLANSSLTDIMRIERVSSRAAVEAADALIAELSKEGAE